MGVPSFYRWLVGKYPKVVMEAREGSGDAVDTSLPNPNGIEFDNLYLDMNGIIHPCFHPDDQLFPPLSFDEVFHSIFSYIDRIFRIVRPRKLLYMAIDGVAPRAKMNQQRARRYRTAKDAEVAEAEEKKLRKQFLAEGRQGLPKQESEVWDSNVITPGTVFMEKLSRALEYYIRLRLNNDPGWKKLKVILSDANVPGEGEHKIMSFIRLQRNLPGYRPNTSHCLYGLDADLIMLALATHEMHFTILREDVQSQQTARDITLALEKSFPRAQYEKLKTRESFGKAARMSRSHPNKPYQFLKIWTLRKYLELDLRISDPPFEIDVERLIDDFIFMCFFTGNDFLPHIPSIEIHEGAIDLLIHVYKSEFKKIGGYLVDTSRMKHKKAAYIKVKHVERFILAVGSFEEKIFEKRQRIWQNNLQKLLRERQAHMGDDSDDFHYPTHESTYLPVFTDKCSRLESPKTSTSKEYNHASGSVLYIHSDTSDAIENTKALMQTLKNIIKEKSDLFKHGCLSDKVRLGFPGWRERYYKEKFSATSPEKMKSLQKELITKYTEGLCWVLQYYFAGVCSWNWFYPFHYGPFASDIKGISCSCIQFALGAPFKPFDQLMSVLPPSSAHALPKSFQHLMTDQQSGLKEFYPTDFDVDVDGKRYLWQGIVKLPFIAEGLLTTNTQKLEAELDEDERERNSAKLDKIFVLRSHDLGEDVYFLHHSHKHHTEKGRKEMNIPINCNKSGGMNGFLCLRNDKHQACVFSTPVKEMDNIMDDHVVSGFYKNPTYHDHVARLLENVAIPSEEITESDIVQRNLWHEQEGRPAPQPFRGEPQHYHSRVSNAARNGRQSNSPTLPGTGRGEWKVAESGWGGRGRGASEGPFHQQIPRSRFVGDWGYPSVCTGRASRPTTTWGVVEERASCAGAFSTSQAADGGTPWQMTRVSQEEHGGAANWYAPAGRGRQEGSPVFGPLAGVSPVAVARSSRSGRGGPAEAKVRRGRGPGRGRGGEGVPGRF